MFAKVSSCHVTPRLTNAIQANVWFLHLLKMPQKFPGAMEMERNISPWAQDVN